MYHDIFQPYYDWMNASLFSSSSIILITLITTSTDHYYLQYHCSQSAGGHSASQTYWNKLIRGSAKISKTLKVTWTWWGTLPFEAGRSGIQPPVYPQWRGHVSGFHIETTPSLLEAEMRPGRHKLVISALTWDMSPPQVWNIDYFNGTEVIYFLSGIDALKIIHYFISWLWTWFVNRN